MAVQALRQRRLKSRWSPRATPSASPAVTGTDITSSVTVFPTVCHKVGSVRTFR
jgi:hypothetical protein